MNFLYLAPLPPPITGHSIAAKVLYDYLRCDHNVAVIDLSIASANDGSVTFQRCVEVVKAIFNVWKKRNEADVIYLTISESVFGNLKDLLIYLICFKNLDKFYIHLHGGSIKKLLFDLHPFIRWLNAIAIRRMAGVIVSGRSHAAIFASMIDNNRIHTIPNFAQDQLFINDLLIQEKFSNLNVLRLLYISGMTIGKGYLYLLEAYQSLEDEIKKKVRIDFAGRFDSESEREDFIQRVVDVPGITYHGVIDDAAKISLFAKAHIFCLPTTFLEGQPISILEAYASGCVVVTTGQDGIRDIFTKGINGYEIATHDPESISSAIRKLLLSSSELIGIAQNNKEAAIARYRTDVFTKCVEKVLMSSHDSGAIN